MGVGDDPADQPDAGMDLMEDLELPGKPGKLWNTVRDRVRAALSESDGSAAYSIGGGTVLAARWDHRESTDVDLLTTDPQGMVPKTARTERGLAETLNGELALGRVERNRTRQREEGESSSRPGQERPCRAEPGDDSKPRDSRTRIRTVRRDGDTDAAGTGADGMARRPRDDWRTVHGRERQEELCTDRELHTGGTVGPPGRRRSDHRHHGPARNPETEHQDVDRAEAVAGSGAEMGERTRPGIASDT